MTKQDSILLRVEQGGALKLMLKVLHVEQDGATRAALVTPRVEQAIVPENNCTYA